jgi:serine/threonine protein kinase
MNRTTAPRALQVGDTVDGRYRLRVPLGAGAFGEVWQADQLVDGQDIGASCAIKIMRLVSSARGSSASARSLASTWLNEVKALVQGQAEGTIPRIHDANVWNEHAYIAMELLQGETLFARLARGAIPWRRALFIADQIARALETAHALGSVHRDLKPQNVILAGPRRACVIDWGIATLFATVSRPQAAIEPRSTVPDSADTEMAPEVAQAAPPRPIPIGTPGYIAPEVYEGEPPAFDQDTFALGVVLYEMLTGCLPHDVERPDRSSKDGANNADRVRAYRSSLEQATQDYALTPLSERAPSLPRALIELVDTMLSRKPSDRPKRLRAEIERVSRFPRGVPMPPYAGFTKLGAEHGGLFFGQDDAIAHVLRRLETERAVLLWGPSGSGKSSLALAGVAVRMDRALFLDTDGWAIHVVRPSEAHTFRVAPDAPASQSALGQVVVVDQLEEVVDLGAAVRESFCRAVAALVDGTAPVVLRDVTIDPSQKVRLVATIRDDLEWRVDREVPALRTLLDRRIIVKGVDANFARSLIEEPARAAGFHVEAADGVAREVEERLSADAAKLPVIQFALTEWWGRRDETRKLLPASAWRELGGVDGALSFMAEGFFGTLDVLRQDRLRVLFLRFFRNDRRQPVADEQLTATDRGLVNRLVELRLVSRRERRGSAAFYEVDHESLAQYWKRLKDWLTEAQEDRLLADAIERDAGEWDKQRETDRLWKARRLVAAEDLADAERVDLSPQARAFIAAGRRAARRGRVILVGAVGTIGLAVVVAVATVISMQAAANSRIKGALNLANQKTSEAEAEREKANRAQADAEIQRQRAEDERKGAAAERDKYQASLSSLEARVNHATLAQLQQIQREVRSQMPNAGPSPTGPVAHIVSISSSAAAAVGEPP